MIVLSETSRLQSQGSKQYHTVSHSSLNNMAPCERCVCQFCGKSLGLFGIDGFGVWRRRHEKRCRQRQETSQGARRDGNAQHCFVRSVLRRAAQPHSHHSSETNEGRIRKLPTLLQGTQGAQGGMPSLAAQNQIYSENVLDRRNQQLIRAVLTEYLKPKRHTRHTQLVDVVADSASNSGFPPCPFPVFFGFGKNSEILFLRAACRQTFQPLEVLAEQFIADLPENKSVVLEALCDLSMKRNLDYLGDHVWKSCKGLLFLLRGADVLGQCRPDLMERLLKAFAPLRSDKDWKVQISANVLVTTVESVMTVKTPDLPGCVYADVPDGLKNFSITN